MPDVVHIFSMLPAAAPGEVPDWVHLLPAGSFSGVDGRGPFELADPDAVMAASMAAGKLPLDENHATDRAAPDGRPSPARGWIVELQARADGIWGRVDWTAAGRALMADRAYRGISPVIVSERSGGRVRRLLRASLVNDPNLPLTTLHDRSRQPMDFIAQLRAALGLSADTTEDAVLAAVTAAKTRLDAHAASTASIARVAGLPADAAPAAVATRVELHFQGADSEEAKLRQLVTTLQAEVTTLAAAGRRAAAEAYVDDAIKAGKPVRPLRDHYISRHMSDPAAVEKEIGALISIHSGGVKPPPAAAGAAATLSDEQLQVCSLMGLDPAKYAETLKGQKEAL